MTTDTVKQLITTYLGHMAENLNLDTLTEEKVVLPLANKLGINHYQVFVCQFLQDQDSELAFLFVYINSPDRLIAHKLFNLVNDLAWYFTKQGKEILPAIIPVLIYDGQEDFEPETLKKLYSSPERAPQFFFEFIDLKHNVYSLVGE